MIPGLSSNHTQPRRLDASDMLPPTRLSPIMAIDTRLRRANKACMAASSASVQTSLEFPVSIFEEAPDLAMAQTAGWQTTMKMFTYARKGTLSQQAPGKGLKINPQVSNLRTAQCRTQKEPHKQKTKDPQTQTTKHVPQASFLETFPTYQTHLTFVIGG